MPSAPGAVETSSRSPCALNSARRPWSDRSPTRPSGMRVDSIARAGTRDCRRRSATVSDASVQLNYARSRYICVTERLKTRNPAGRLNNGRRPWGRSTSRMTRHQGQSLRSFREPSEATRPRMVQLDPSIDTQAIRAADGARFTSDPVAEDGGRRDLISSRAKSAMVLPHAVDPKIGARHAPPVGSWSWSAGGSTPRCAAGRRPRSGAGAAWQRQIPSPRGRSGPSSPVRRRAGPSNSPCVAAWATPALHLAEGQAPEQSALSVSRNTRNG